MYCRQHCNACYDAMPTMWRVNLMSVKEGRLIPEACLFPKSIKIGREATHTPPKKPPTHLQHGGQDGVQGCLDNLQLLQGGGGVLLAQLEVKVLDLRHDSSKDQL